MSTAATIMAVLGINTKPYSDGFRAANNITDQHTKKITDASKAHDKLWNSNNRVTNQAQGFARSLLYANNATDVLSAGLDRLENSLKLGLGGGIALAVGAVLVARVGAVIAKARELREEIAQIGRDTNTSDARFDSLSVIDARLAGITDKLKQLKKEHESTVAALASSGPATQRGVDAENRKYAGEKGGLEADRQRNQGFITEKARRANDIEEIRQSKGDAAAKREELFDRQAEEGAAARKAGNADLEIETGRKLVLALESLERAIQETQKASLDRTQMTLEELAAAPEVATAGMSYEQWKAGQDAREVMRLEAQAERQRAGFDPTGAAVSMSKADELRAGIGNLKESDKDLRGAINASELPGLLKRIEEKIGGKLTNK